MEKLPPRWQLLESGLTEVCRRNHDKALTLFDAAVHRARASGFVDCEAHFFRFVTNYFFGDFAPAVRECALCIRSVEETSLLAELEGVILPKDSLIPKLERLLAHTMIKNGSSMPGLTLHFWKRRMGVYYPSKKSCGILTAASRAARALARSRKEVEIHFHLFDDELRPFTRFMTAGIRALKRKQRILMSERALRLDGNAGFLALRTS